jgi:hypothetical protein
VRRLNEVHISDGATIGGQRDIQVRVRRSPYSRPRFYFHRAIWLAASLLVGWLALVLFPGFFHSTTQAVSLGWLSLGLGALLLVGVPVAMVVIAVTVVGLPLSLILLATYLIAIYLTNIWVGAFLGRILLKSTGTSKSDWMLALLVGMLVLTVVRFIPYIGPLIHLGVVCLGLGAFAWQLYRYSRPAAPLQLSA